MRDKKLAKHMAENRTYFGGYQPANEHPVNIVIKKQLNRYTAWYADYREAFLSRDLTTRMKANIGMEAAMCKINSLRLKNWYWVEVFPIPRI